MTVKTKNLIAILLIFFVSLLLINSALVFYNGNAIVKNHSLKNETELIKQRAAGISTYILHRADLAVRGFALTKNEKLAGPILHILKDKDSIFNSLETLLVKQQYDITKFRRLKASVENYLIFSTQMIELVRQDSMSRFAALLNEDRGYKLWKQYEEFSVPLFAYEDTINAAADQKYIEAVADNRIIQAILVLLGGPLIIYIIWKLRSEEHQRTLFLSALEQNNRKYIFDNGSSKTVTDWKEAVAGSINNFQHANEFITKISEGNYTAGWEGLNESNQNLNQNNLAGNLLKMQEHLRQTKIKDEQLNWATAGLAKFVEIIHHHHDYQKLGDAIVSNVVNYTHSNQGGLFIVNDENAEHIHLELLSCYAWDKKRFSQKTIHEGQGLAGQCWQEGVPVFITEVPADYVNITSGLGHALPRCIFIVPLKADNIIYGVLELASFQPYQAHEREFLIKLSENIASAIAAIKIADRTKRLLEQSQLHTEEMRSQEEEMRQNMEELQATQEGLERLMKESQAKELYMRSLMDASTDSILTFDHEYKIIHFNEVARKGYLAAGIVIDQGSDLLQLIAAAERESFKLSMDKGLSNEMVEMSYHHVPTDNHYIVKYIPIRDEQGIVTAVAQFSTNITHLMQAQEETKKMLRDSQAQTEELRAQEEELRATMEAEVQRNKDLERANSQNDAQKQMMLKVIDKLKEKEKESQGQAAELRAQEEELRAQQEELRQNMEELEATLEAESKRGREIERANAQLEAQKLMMTKTLEKFRQREKELAEQLDLKEKTITSLTRTINEN